MQNQKLNVEQAYKTMVVIWAALFVSQLLFLVVIYGAKPEVYRFDFSKPLLGEDSVLVIALAFASLTSFAVSFVMKKKLLEQAIAAQNVGMVQTAMIVGCALCEAISLFGLVLVFVQGYQYFFLFFALALAGFIFHFPRRENLIAASYKK